MLQTINNNQYTMNKNQEVMHNLSKQVRNTQSRIDQLTKTRTRTKPSVPKLTRQRSITPFEYFTLSHQIETIQSIKTKLHLLERDLELMYQAREKQLQSSL